MTIIGLIALTLILILIALLWRGAAKAIIGIVLSIVLLPFFLYGGLALADTFSVPQPLMFFFIAIALVFILSIHGRADKDKAKRAALAEQDARDARDASLARAIAREMSAANASAGIERAISRELEH